jgi:hypothetical protein
MLWSGFRFETTMVHKHFCRNCNAMMAEGDFDCGRDADHDFELCAKCQAREKAAADWISAQTRRWH